MNHGWIQILCFTFLLFLSSISYGLEKNSKGGFLDFNLYPYMSDVENDNSITINIFTKLPHRLSYFSLTNMGNSADESELEETDSFYTEQNIRWQIAEGSPLDLTLQMNFRSGVANDRHRLGVRWRLNNTSFLQSFFKSIHLAYSINLHAVQLDHEDADIWQMEHVFKLKLPYLSDRLYLTGFADHTFNQDLASDIPENPVVGEAQLGYRLVEHLYGIVEYRINEYRQSQVSNTAIGIEYKMVW